MELPHTAATILEVVLRLPCQVCVAPPLDMILPLAIIDAGSNDFLNLLSTQKVGEVGGGRGGIKVQVGDLTSYSFVLA